MAQRARFGLALVFVLPVLLISFALSCIGETAMDMQS